MIAPQADRRPIPFTVIGGFLGAGKTTAVNALLESVAGRRIAVLVNDFGGLAIDAALVAERNATTISLTNGCVCCSLVGGLVRALLDTMALEPAPDCIVVEASGVSDPRRIAQIARADPGLIPDATIVLVAADQWRTLSRDRYVGDTVKQQVAAADFLVLNKVDNVNHSELDSLRAELRARAPRARLLESVGARLPYSELLGHALDDALGKAAALDASFAASDAHAHQFATRVLRSSAPVSSALLRRALDDLPPAVLRAKGFVRLDETPAAWHLVQTVGSRWSLVTAAPRDPDEDSALVLMGPTATLADADLAALAAAFGQALPNTSPVPAPARVARGR
jgi:G3E family GTPase